MLITLVTPAYNGIPNNQTLHIPVLITDAQGFIVSSQRAWHPQEALQQQATHLRCFNFLT